MGSMETVIRGRRPSHLHGPDETDVPADLLDRFESARELLSGVRGHERRADERSSGRGSRREDAVDEDAGFVQALHHFQSDGVLSMMSRVSSAAATEAGGGAAEKIIVRALCLM